MGKGSLFLMLAYGAAGKENHPSCSASPHVTQGAAVVQRIAQMEKTQPPPTDPPTKAPTMSPPIAPTMWPTMSPTISPTMSPTISPTMSPTISPLFTEQEAFNDDVKECEDNHESGFFDENA